MSILVLILFTYFGYSQNDEKKVNDLVDQFSDELYKDEIEKFLYSKRYCVGKTVIFKNKDGSMCFSNGTYYEVYFIWKEDDQVMIKKIDNCGRYKSIAIKDDLIFNVFSENIDLLKAEEVKGYTVENPENVPVQRSDVYPCFREFLFRYGDETFKKEYNLFHLTNESKYENLYYEYNRSLVVVDLDQILEDLIMDQESKFEREKK
jgi:hypothetical protein